MLWAASCLCFFGFLRMGEAVVPSNSSYDPEVHLSAGDVKVDNRENPSFVEVRIKASKTDVFRKGVTIYLGVTGVNICLVAAILSYMVQSKVMTKGTQRPSFALAMAGLLLGSDLYKSCVWHSQLEELMHLPTQAIVSELERRQLLQPVGSPSH